MDFDKIIADFIRDKEEKNKKELIISKYSASMLGNCLRQNYYAYTSPIEFSIEKLRIFEIGKVLHEWIAKLLSNTPHAELISSEKEISLIDLESDITISGRLDDVILIKENGKKIVIEVKSIKSLEYLTEPKKPHIMQLMIYLKALQHYKIDEGIILYINKNNLTTKSFRIKYDDKILKEAFERAKTLHHYLTNKILPPPEAKIKKEMNWACAYCQYSEICSKHNI